MSQLSSQTSETPRLEQKSPEVYDADKLTVFVTNKSDPILLSPPGKTIIQKAVCE